MKKLCLIVLEQNLATQLKIGAYYKNKGWKGWNDFLGKE